MGALFKVSFHASVKSGFRAVSLLISRRAEDKDGSRWDGKNSKKVEKRPLLKLKFTVLIVCLLYLVYWQH